MPPERWRQIEELYHAAQKDRAVLANADPELRREVESLLAQEEAPFPTLTMGEPIAAGAENAEAFSSSPRFAVRT